MKAAGKISRAKRERGSSVVEYCLLSALIALSCMAVVRNFNKQLYKPFITISFYLEGGGSKGTEW